MDAQLEHEEREALYDARPDVSDLWFRRRDDEGLFGTRVTAPLK